MAFINLKTKENQLKIVYWGPGRGGKTTNLQYIYKNYHSKLKSKMLKLNTYGDRTLFFDFMPFKLGKINGFDTTVQLYTVPGQIRYNQTRKIVLNGVDGIVFVADLLAPQRYRNCISLKNLHENLEKFNKNIFKTPLVFQYNKIDLAKDGIPILSPKVLEKDLNSKLKRPAFIASALTGDNVVETLKTIISLTANTLNQNQN
jgi:mutual gliding-motility protein MglA